MTLISPLSNIHKIGTFWNIENKSKDSLLEITEEKSKKIYQITKFKNSNLYLNDFLIEDLKISNDAMIVKSNLNTRILWTGPNQWLLVSDNQNLKEELNKFDTDNFAVTDLSHTRTIIKIKGNDTLEVLKKGCPFDFNNFKKNMSVNSVYHSIAITLDFLSDNPHTIRVMSLRSFGESLYHSITDASLEYGYNCV